MYYAFIFRVPFLSVYSHQIFKNIYLKFQLLFEHQKLRIKEERRGSGLSQDLVHPLSA